MELERVKPFLGSKISQKIQSGVNILGICYDGTTSFRPGTRFGPDALREASYGQETFSPYFRKDIEEKKIFDLGNLPQFTSRFDRIQECFAKLVSEADLRQSKIITLGGEHSLTQIPVSHYLKTYDDLVVIQFDAHADLREQYLDDPHSHASVMRRISEAMNDKQKIIQYGIRSGTRNEYDFMESRGTLMPDFKTLYDFVQNTEAPLYITLDLDFFDPSELPGTGTPEAGGHSFKDWIKLLKLFENKNIIGADVVELSPPIDSTGNSNCFAAKVLRELIAIL